MPATSVPTGSDVPSSDIPKQQTRLTFFATLPPDGLGKGPSMVDFLDGICNSAATAGGLPIGQDTWAAFVGTTESSAPSKFSYALSTKLVNRAGETVIEDMRDLFNGAPLINPIRYNAAGEAWNSTMGGNTAVVGLDGKGALAPNCDNWSNTSGQARAVGLDSSTGWISGGLKLYDDCNQNMKIICIQKPGHQL